MRMSSSTCLVNKVVSIFPLTKLFEIINVDTKLYKSMIDSLVYLTASRPNIMFSVCLCARVQSCPKESHLIPVKRIIRYLKGTIAMGADNFS